jgi:hypothetical protein
MTHLPGRSDYLSLRDSLAPSFQGATQVPERRQTALDQAGAGRVEAPRQFGGG